MTRKHIVMYLPYRSDPAKGEVIAADLFPLELQQIAGVALERVLDACDEAGFTKAPYEYGLYHRARRLMEKFKFSETSSVGTAGTGNG